MKRFIFCLALLSSLNTLHALTSTIGGPTGLITVPTADSLKYKEFSISTDYLIGSYKEDDNYSYKLNIGTFENFELGVVGEFGTPNGKEPREGMFLNVKYYLIADNTRFPLKLAIGAQNLSSKDLTNAYMMASKKIQEDLSMHFGFKSIFTKEEIKPVIMGGLSYALDNKINLIADVNSKGETYYLNTGVEYFITQSFVLKGSIIDIASDKENPTTEYIFGISYNKFL
jgi:hypothetical protein